MTGFTAPTADQVKEALRRIPTPQLRRAFYEGLNNPLWLEPLRHEGAFTAPPPRVTRGDGSTGDPYWPEIEYVARVAKHVPKVAVDILLTLETSENAWVRRALFSIGAAVPASEGARLKPVLKAWLASGFGGRTDPREMVRFAVTLIAGGELSTGEWLANALFRPGPREGSREPDLALEEYSYEEGLPQVAEALGERGLPMVLGWLVEYEKAAGQLEGWPFSRPSIRERRDSYGDVEDALIDAVRDLAMKFVELDPNDTVDRLLGPNLILARRIAMFAVACTLSKVENAAPASSAIIAVGARLLADPLSIDERCRIEFGELAREVARHSSSALDPLVGLLSVGPALSVSELRARLRRDEDESETDTQARVTEYAERWEHSWLASVGASALPESLIPRLRELDQRLGAIDDPLRSPFVTTSWTGPNSPLAQDEMAGMSPEELVAHLESWHDLGDGWGPEPSHEGQARELTAILTASPQSLSGITGLTARLRPTYLRAILRAWAEAFRAGSELDWKQVDVTVRDVLTHGDELDRPREGGNMDDDPDFIGAKQAAVGLLGELVKKVEPARVSAETLSRLADTLINLAPGESAWTAYAEEGRESGMDPLTLSLNWQWPILIRGVAALVAHGPTALWSERARTVFLAELERPDPRGAAHAVVGESLGRLLTADEVWTQCHIADWFGGVDGIDRDQQIALSTAMAIHRYHRTLFELLSPSMLSAVDLPEPIADGWQQHNSTPIQRIGEWAVKALIYGDVDWDSPVVDAFFSKVDARVRGAALGHVAWEFLHAESVDDSIRDRFVAVWDSRISHVESTPSDSAELREFHWVVRSNKFDTQWWLLRLQRSLELDPDLASERYMIAKDIARAAEVNPRLALDVTTLLILARQGHGMAVHDLSPNALPMVIARALSSDDDQLKADATLLMNEMGEAGLLDLSRQVDAVLEGAVTQEDVS